MKNNFKLGDMVYFHMFGWGKIVEIDKDLKVKFESLEFGKWFDDETSKLLSFTEYKLEGFSQERPEELPNKGDVVWVSEDRKYWEISMFLEYDSSEKDCPYIVSANMIEGDHQCCKYLTTKNPFLNEKN